MHYYGFVMAIVIESGAVYCALLVCELVLYTLNNNGTLIVVSMLSQVTVGVSAFARRGAS